MFVSLWAWEGFKMFRRDEIGSSLAKAAPPLILAVFLLTSSSCACNREGIDQVEDDQMRAVRLANLGAIEVLAAKKLANEGKHDEFCARLTMAREHIRQALKLQPDSAQALHNPLVLT